MKEPALVTSGVKRVENSDIYYVVVNNVKYYMGPGDTMIITQTIKIEKDGDYVTVQQSTRGEDGREA